MSRKGFIVWGMLIIPQIFAVWISHVRGTRGEAAAVDLDLLGLSQEINRVWGRHEAKAGSWKAEISGVANDGLLKRESLMMELRAIERALVERGVEMEIVEDLEAYLATLDGDENLLAINRYIGSLLKWVNPHGKGDPGCALERLALHPGVESVLPGISFEMSGNPLEMGRRIRESTQEDLAWELRAMDLVLLKESGNWWMRGNCSYPNWQSL